MQDSRVTGLTVVVRQHMNLNRLCLMAETIIALLNCVPVCAAAQRNAGAEREGGLGAAAAHPRRRAAAAEAGRWGGQRHAQGLTGRRPSIEWSTSSATIHVAAG